MMYWKDISRVKACVLLFVLLNCVIAPKFVHAEFWITEIHYNPEGADSGFEWIEVWNNDSDSKSLEDFKFREGGVNHGIKESLGGFVLSSFEYVVIADNPDKFAASNPNFTGTVFDSAFSLSNSGEKLSLIEPAGSVVFEVEYANATGGNGNGQSVGLVDAIWREVVTSPGVENKTYIPSVVEEVTQDEADKEVVNTTQPTQAVDELPATYIEIKDPEYSEKVIKVDAQGDRTVMAGVEYLFAGKVYGLQGGIIEEPVAQWNWGDGTKTEDVVASHRYKYPGVYTATLSAHVSRYSSRDRVQITVIEPALFLGITRHSERDLLQITNNSDYALEVSGYRIQTEEGSYEFPEGSFINNKQAVVLDAEVLGFEVFQAGTVYFIDGVGNQIDVLESGKVLLERELARVEQDANEPGEDVVGDTVEKEHNKEKGVVIGALTHSVVYRNESPTFAVEHEPQIYEEGVPQEQTSSTEISSFEQLQQAQMLGSIQDTDRSGSVWYMISLGILSTIALGLYLWTYLRERKQASLSGVNIVD